MLTDAQSQTGAVEEPFDDSEESSASCTLSLTKSDLSILKAGFKDERPYKYIDDGSVTSRPCVEYDSGVCIAISSCFYILF